MALARSMLLHFNGINGTSGKYLCPPVPMNTVGSFARGEKVDPKHFNELKWRHEQRGLAHFGVREGVDPKDLAQSGWGVMFAHDADPAIRQALQPLLNHRKNQAGAIKAGRYKEFIGQAGYRPGESKQQFLARLGAGPGPVDPDRVPYYLLIVGSPEAIPFRFQYQLDVAYAVGRIHFDKVEDYAHYANSVVSAEKKTFKSERTATFFGVRNAGDPATQLSADGLVMPLAQAVEQNLSSWKVNKIIGKEAIKSRLSTLFRAEETLSFLFTASHGMGFANGDPKQLAHQGALLCQDWPGPLEHVGSIPEDYYFSADDITQETSAAGLISFHFACYGAGTPKLDDFAHHAFTQPSTIAPYAFVGRLPQRLLAHSKGGALAVVGHVERAWGCSIEWPGAGRQVTVFEDVVKRLLTGHPVGSALEPLNERYAELSSDLNTELEDLKFGKEVDEFSLAGMWLANNDARSYAIVGDPAVRLAV